MKDLLVGRVRGAPRGSGPPTGQDGDRNGGGPPSRARLLELIFERDELAELDTGERRLAIRSIVAQALAEGAPDEDLGACVNELVSA
ncbi:MAG: hypothetical protein ACRDJ5_02195, partial [Actinomycetota bacterium]